MKKYIVTLLWLVMCGAAPRFAGADKVTYTYDDAGRLLRATYANGTALVYTYDAAGNLLSRAVGLPTYLVGDAFPAGTDVIGGFGDNNLNNLDLIYALRAVTNVPGFRPAACSDRFDAMDSYPLDTDTVRGGDGQLNNLDLIRTLRRVTNIDTSRPVRASRGLTCTASAPQFALQGRREQGLRSHEQGSPSTEPSAGAIELGQAEPSSDGARVPVYLRATRDLVLESLSFSLGNQSSASTQQFLSGDAPPPTLVDSEVQGVLAIAWLQGGLRVSAGQRLLLGYAEVPGMGIEAAIGMQIYGANASKEDGTNLPLSFPNLNPAPPSTLPSL